MHDERIKLWTLFGLEDPRGSDGIRRVTAKAIDCFRWKCDKAARSDGSACQTNGRRL
jgi:hypothetical protein